MPEPPVSPKLKELVLMHEKRAKESSNLDTLPRQKPKAKFRDSFILDTKDEGLYSTLTENGHSDCNSITQRSVKNSDGNQKNETIVKSQSQPIIFQSTIRSDVSKNISPTQDFLKEGDQSSAANDQEQLEQLTSKANNTYRSPDDLDVIKKDTSKVNTAVNTSNASGKNPDDCEITDTTVELGESDRVDGNKVVKRSHINGKLDSIQKRFSLDSFDRDSRHSSKETNGYEISAKESPQSTRRSSLVRGDSIKALQQKFQQATVSSSLKQSESDSFYNHQRQIEEPSEPADTVTQKNNSSFLDNSAKVTDVQDVLTRMRNADLIVENGETKEDIEARTLLNKFLGASVVLCGMEQGAMVSPSFSPEIITTTENSGTIVKPLEHQRAQKSPTVTKNQLGDVRDERRLRILLESCQDHDQRRQIRARLRTIMAEQKARADVVALAVNNDDCGGSAAAATGCDNEETINEVTESTNMSTKTENSSNVKTDGSSDVKTEVHTRTTTSSHRLTKANSVSSSPFAKFQQLERQNSAPNSQSRPCYKFTDPALARSASSIKDRLLCWVKAQTKEYKNLQITNFSTSWNDGLAFCALIHHFYPEAFDYDKLKPENRRENFEIAFKVAEDEAGIAPLLDVEDMVVMRKPDWKCVFTYVQTFYRRFHNSPQAAKPSF